MIKKSRYPHRIEIRLDTELKEELCEYCKSNKETKAKILRGAIKQYLELGFLKDILWDSLQNKKFCISFQKFLEEATPDIRSFFEQFWGSEEERLIFNTSEKILWTIKPAIVTSRGKRALSKKFSS